MSQSLLLEVARQSIVEVLEASRSIDVPHLKEEYPLLNEKMATAVTLYLGEEIRAHYCSLYPKKSLLDDLIYTAKIAAFESHHHAPITTSEYLHVSIQVSILTPLKTIVYNSLNDLISQITPQEDGIIMSYQNRESYLFPNAWTPQESTLSVLRQLSDTLHIHHSLEQEPEISLFQVQNAKDRAILKLATER